MLKQVFIGLLCFMGGFAYCSMYSYVEYNDHCTTYKTNGVEWIGYRAINEGNERRCFWLESRFPYRIRQGVERL